MKTTMMMAAFLCLAETVAAAPETFNDLAVVNDGFWDTTGRVAMAVDSAASDGLSEVAVDRIIHWDFSAIATIWSIPIRCTILSLQ